MNEYLTPLEIWLAVGVMLAAFVVLAIITVKAGAPCRRCRSCGKLLSAEQAAPWRKVCQRCTS